MSGAYAAIAQCDLENHVIHLRSSFSIAPSLRVTMVWHVFHPFVMSGNQTSSALTIHPLLIEIDLRRLFLNRGFAVGSSASTPADFLTSAGNGHALLLPDNSGELSAIPSSPTAVEAIRRPFRHLFFRKPAFETSGSSTFS